MKTDFLTSAFIALRTKLHRRALSILHDDEDARDALQDAYCKLWENGPMDTDDEARNKLFRAVHNVCIDRLRRTSTVGLPRQLEEVATAESDDDPDELMALLSRGLSESQRKIVAMVANEQLEYAEIALKLNMTEGAVRTALSRARMKMRENYNNLNK